MLFATVKSIFDIDNVGKRWGVRILYLVTVVLNAAVHFNPFADTDFSPLESWLMSIYNMTEYDPDVYNTVMSTMPLTKGNIIYLLTLLLGELIMIVSAYIYAAVYVRQYRIEKAEIIAKNGTDSINYAAPLIPDTPIQTSKLVGRLCLLMLVTVFVALPLLTVSMYFLFFALFGLPFIFTAPVAYLAGDKGIFNSIPYVVKLSFRYYFANMRSIAIVLFAVLVADFLIPMIANVSLTAYYIVDSAVTTWLWLSIARLAALSYCTMKDYPIKSGRRPYAI